VADRGRVRLISGGNVSTFAGDGTSTTIDPLSLALHAGTLYVADFTNAAIRTVSISSLSGTITTIAGSAGAGFMDGAPAVARFATPAGIALDVTGNIYVGDGMNNRIRKIAATSYDVSTLAGTATASFADGANALFDYPRGVALDESGNVYVADTDNQRIRRVSPDGNTCTLAGTGTAGFMDGDGTIAQFHNPQDIALGASCVLFVADFDNDRVRMVVPASCP
jgi:sugar lactone lactonase YvrE